MKKLIYILLTCAVIIGCSGCVLPIQEDERDNQIPVVTNATIPESVDQRNVSNSFEYDTNNTTIYNVFATDNSVDDGSVPDNDNDGAGMISEDNNATDSPVNDSPDDISIDDNVSEE
jgi:hypothetical protein